jgi:hypothetical protein
MKTCIFLPLLKYCYFAGIPSCIPKKNMSLHTKKKKYIAQASKIDKPEKLNMKKSLLLIATGLMLITTSKAQKAEIGGFYGISFNSQIRTYYGQFKVND